MRTSDGGPAFPRPASQQPESGVGRITEQRGMGMREHYATHAMAALIALSDRVNLNARTIAADAFAVADAMLRESEK